MAHDPKQDPGHNVPYKMLQKKTINTYNGQDF